MTLTWDTGLKPFGVPLKVNVTALLWIFLFASQGLLAIPLALILLASVAAHEYGHVWMADRQGLPVQVVILHALGGAAVSNVSYALFKPYKEVKIALAGPAVSVILAALGFLLCQLHLNILFIYLFSINAILAVFNLLPIFPMDGGRVLRGLLAQRFGPRKAVRVAEIVTYVLAAGLFGVALYFHMTMMVFIMPLIAFMAYQERKMTIRVLDGQPPPQSPYGA